MYKKSFFISMVALFSLLLLFGCSKDEGEEFDDEYDDEIEDVIEKMPSSLSIGNEFILSNSSPMQFGFFRVTGLGTGQWAEKKVDYISINFSDATYTYTVTGENTAKLSSLNTQYRTGRMWSVDLSLTFETPASGSYVLKDRSIDSGVSYTTRGTFVLE